MAANVRQELMDLIDRLILCNFCGNLQVNFYKGGISSINKNETIKLGEKEEQRDKR